MVGVTRSDSVRNEEMRRTAMGMTLADKANANVLGWLRHIERINGEVLPNEVHKRN